VIKAMRAGADDFVVKPVSPERLKVSIQNLLKVNALTEEVKRLNKKVSGALTFSDLIASSPGMANVMRWASAVRPRTSPSSSKANRASARK
jgi:DNA-binding NtrC family response regulator